MTTLTARARSGGDADTAVVRRRRRIGGTALLVALTLMALTACRPVWPVQVVFLNDADAAAAWMEADYTANGASYGAGQIADTILALAAVGGDRAVAEGALADLEALTPAYTHPGGSVSIGATAKVILAVQALHDDPTDFGGLDLEAALRSTLVVGGADDGRFGSSGVFTQALAMMALARTPGKVPVSSGTWLAAQQCPDGSFSWGACVDADVDHTALAGSALVAAGGQPGGVTGASLWLVANQNGDGGFSYTGDTSNASSTGLAAQLLRRTSKAAEADAAGAFVESLQYGTSAGAKAGAIAYQAGDEGNLVLATTQGALAFGAGPFSELAFPVVIGAPCPDSDGVTVVVDLTRHDNSVRVACATGPQATGWVALEAAGFTVVSVPGFEGQVACTINSHPSAGYPECWNTGYWSYWHDETGSGTWTAASAGAAGRTPPAGSVDGWRYEPDWASHDAAPPSISPAWS